MKELSTPYQGPRFYGCLSMAMKGLPLTQENVDQMLGKPLLDADSNKIGIIDRIDLELDEFSGVYIKH